MNDAAENLSSGQRGEMGYVGTEERPHFLSVNHPQTMCGAAMVIVPPFGYEAICSRRALRHLAEDAASAGMLAVRIDPDGTGNSAGGDLDSNRVDAWVSSIHHACDLARNSGADHLVLVGVRLGAMLACLAACEREDVSAFVAIAGIANGKAWLRECRMLQMSLNLAADPDAPERPADQIQEVIGFALTEQTRERIASLNLSNSTKCPASRILLIERSEMPPEKAWAESLAALGADVRTERLPGYSEMVLDPHHAQIPQTIFDATVAFVMVSSAPTAPSPVAPATALRRRAGMPAAGQVFIEESIQLDECMSGIATYPNTPINSAVILLNSGAIGTVGPNRLYVELARRLAAAGDLVFRLDLSGIADSAPRNGEVENTVYSRHAIEDVSKAVAWARQAGAREISVAGLCSGGYHALKAALAGQAIDRIVLINPLTFQYVQGMTLDLSPSRVTEDVNRYAESIRSADSWKKLLRGEVEIGRLLRVIVHRGRMLFSSKLKGAMRGLPFSVGEDLGRDLLSLASRGVRLHFIFSASDPGATMLREQGGSAIVQLSRRNMLEIDVIDGPDHTFTARWTHEPFLQAVAEALHR